MVVTLKEKISTSFWWIVSIAITAYLCLVIANTVAVLF
jgi:hypothetical protein